MSNSSPKQIGLLLFDGSELLPTEVDRTSAFTSAAGLNYDSFLLSAENTGGAYHRRYRQFKRDLLLTDGALNDRNRLGWKMLALYPIAGRRPKGLLVAEHYLKGERNRTHYFSAVQAAQLFLWRVCSHAVGRVKELFPGAADIQVHFTVPAYDEEDAKNSRARRYRDHLKQAIRGFLEAKSDEFEGVDFRILNGRGEWLYEPYAVYYYYSTLEEARQFHRPGATYLIVDMGGSTTDFSVVQVNQEGTRFRKYPMCTSVQIGGADFDWHLLSGFLGNSVPASQEDQALLLAEVERAKIEVCNGAAQVRLVLGKRTFELTEALLRTSFMEFWGKKVEKLSIAQGLSNFIATVRNEAASNPLLQEFTRFDRVFLAGGSIKLIGLQGILRKQLEELGIETHEDAFAVPRDASPSCVTALGLAAELVQESEQLERAQAVFARINDELGRPYQFSLADVDVPGELARSAEFKDATLVYSNTLHEAYPPDTNGKIKVERAGNRNGYKPHALPAEGTPGSLRFRFRNDIQEMWLQEEHEYAVDFAKIRSHPPTAGDLILSTEIAPRARGEETSGTPRVRFKPSFFFQPHAGGNRVRLDARGPGGRGRVDVPLTRGRVSGDIHICIDFGMSNTTVAVVARDRTFPAAQDLRIMHLAGNGEPSTDFEEAEERGAGADVIENADAVAGDAAGVPEDSRERRADEPRTHDGRPLGGGGEALPLEIQHALESLRTSQRVIEDRLSRLEAATPAEGGGPLATLSTRIGDLIEAVIPVPSTARRKLAHPRDRANEHYATISQPPALGRGGVGEGPLPQLVEDFRNFIRQRDFGAHYPDHVLRAVLSECRNPKARLTVLAGPPGTGKSSLVRLLAEFCNPDLSREEVERSFFLLQPVAPAWYSSASLLGSYSEIDGQFHGTPFLDHLYRAQEHVELTAGTPPRLFFVCLDEFNLAAPEQYFAEFLSRMEAAADSPHRTIEVCTRQEAADLGEAIQVRVGPNLRFFGTINIDASTHLLSPKVLDRSHLVRLTPSFPDLQAVGAGLASRLGLQWFEAALATERLLERVCELCTAARTPLGYRALAKSYEYAAAFSEADVEDVLDDVLCNFLLSRLPGSFAVNSEAYDGQLAEITRRFEKQKLTRSGGLIKNVLGGLPGQHA